MYNYYEAVKDDVIDYIKENYSEDEIKDKLSMYQTKEDFAEKLQEQCWVADSVTGNASGSYYCNAYRAEEAIAHNLDLLGEALNEFGADMGKALEKGAEYCDVTIRCYVLYHAINKALYELEDELEE